MKRLTTLFALLLFCIVQMTASTSTVYLKVGDTYTLNLNAPSYLVGTQWTISDMDAIEFVSNPGTLSTSVMIKALSPRTAANRCLVHCTYYYKVQSGNYTYQRQGYQDWEIIINGNGSGGSDNGTTVTMHISSLSLKVGRTTGVTAYASSTSYTGNYRWSSSDSSVMTVFNAVGPRVDIKGVSEGTAYLRVTLDNGNYEEIPVYVSQSDNGGGGSGSSNNYFVYELTDDGKGYSVGWDMNKSCSGAVVIPSYHNGKPVTEIKNEGFKELNGMTSVTIPNTVTTIGFSAFQKCSSMKSVVIPNSVTRIRFEAFCSCEKLTSITIPNSVTTIENGTFVFCSGLTSVVIPNSVTTIISWAFSEL